MLDLHSSSDRQLLCEKCNAVETSAIVYLAECYSRAENECNMLGIRKRGRDIDMDDEFSKMKLRIIKECQYAIASKARYFNWILSLGLLEAS